MNFFDADERQQAESIGDDDALRTMLNEKVSELGGNRFCVIRLDGTFCVMNVRSELAQEEPYEPLADVLEHDQTFFDYEDITGTVVELYCPSYLNTLNAAGWHLHFVSEDREKGGHVLGLSVDSAELSWDYTDEFEMHLPDGEMFSSLDLTVDQSEDIKKVETDVDREE